MSPMEKAVRVFDSCETVEHLQVAERFLNLAYSQPADAVTMHWLHATGYAMMYARRRVQRNNSSKT